MYTLLSYLCIIITNYTKKIYKRKKENAKIVHGSKCMTFL